MRRWLSLAIGLVALIGADSAHATTTPIGHLVVIFDESASFDHYFATYPTAANPAGEPAFTAAPGTPAVNGLSGSLLTANPNTANPFRLGPAQASTCANSSGYKPEQQAFDGGLMDKFVQFTSCAGNTGMGYYDGNTVTALWNYAQNYALSDAMFGTGFGPSTLGALNLISGQTHGATDVPGQVVGGTVIGNPDPAGDQCGNRTPAATTSFGAAPNIGTKLTATGVTWGWFQGGFRPTGSDGGGAVCNASHTNLVGVSVRDYSANQEPFQYYDATRNAAHTAPASASLIGHDEAGVNHQYDLEDFQTVLATGDVPAVSFLKPPASQDGRPGNSGPLDEQRFLVNTINAIQASSVWPDTAIVIAYGGSGGWYDHVASPILNSSADVNDALDGPGAPPTAGGYQLRCGFGPRAPLLVISPYARINYVDHTVIDQTSILRFIEDNWGTGQLGNSSFDNIPSPKPTIAGLFDFAGSTRAPTVTLDPDTGLPVPSPTPPGTEPPTTTPPTTTPPATTTGEFTFGKLKLKRTRGTAKLPVELPGPGTLALGGNGIKAEDKQVADAGEVKLKINPKGKTKDKLGEHGKAKVKAKVTFTPTGAAAVTHTKKITLIERDAG
jgi:phospholipase C